MAKAKKTLWLLVDLLTPGGVLLAAAWALQKEDVVRHAAEPYAVYFCFGALAAAVLLSWYYDQSGLLGIASAVVLTVLALERWPDAAHIARRTAIVLLPLNFILFAWLKERGAMTPHGLVKVAFVLAQALAVVWIAGETAHGFAVWINAPAQPAVTASLPLTAQVLFAFAGLALGALVIIRRTKVAQGLIWALAAMFLGLRHMSQPEVLLFYSGTAGLILMFAVLEHGYDIAYRDELTGLPGRRAFNNIMTQLGGTYAIAMCDVDNFKSFNDTYGHDAGDQVLKMVSSKLSDVGGGGRAFRYGGEEFLIVFRGRTAREAEPFVESLRQAIANAGFVVRSSERPATRPRRTARVRPANPVTIPISVSIGIAEKSRRHSTPELVLDAADGALYRAKEAGRNCVKVEEGAPGAGGQLRSGPWPKA